MRSHTMKINCFVSLFILYLLLLLLLSLLPLLLLLLLCCFLFISFIASNLLLNHYQIREEIRMKECERVREREQETFFTYFILFRTLVPDFSAKMTDRCHRCEHLYDKLSSTFPFNIPDIRTHSHTHTHLRKFT